MSEESKIKTSSFQITTDFMSKLTAKMDWAREQYSKEYIDSMDWKFTDNGYIVSQPSPAVVPKYGQTSLPRLRVLSLFDGIGTGYYALVNLGFDVEVYYASEIDSNAMLLTRSHFKDNIKQLGSVTDIHRVTLNNIGPIDLLFGGSPCEELSCLNFRRKGITDPTGTGVLFFDFYRIWCHLKQVNEQENRPFYWLFENVANMECSTKDTISKFLGSEPYVLDSVNLSAQKRKRLFWSNFPGIQILVQLLPICNESNIELDDFLIKNLNRSANCTKVGTITTKRNCLNDGSSRDPVNQDGEPTGLYIREIEEIFGFPPHYTDVGDFSISKRQKLLGKSWSVQVVKKIFGLLKGHYAMTK